jgi:hypothetical protein
MRPDSVVATFGIHQPSTEAESPCFSLTNSQRPGDLTD